MPDGDGLDEVEVEPEGGSDGAADPAHHLQVKRTACDIVVADEAEDLRLVGAARIEGVVDDLLDVDDEAGSPEVHVGVLVMVHALADALAVLAGVLGQQRLLRRMPLAQQLLFLVGEFEEPWVEVHIRALPSRARRFVAVHTLLHTWDMETRRYPT